MGRRRAIVLGLVQLLIVLHVTLWLLSREFGWFGGRTLTPVEPSEAMQTLERGVVNAGFLFFALAILSTLIFGRFFCGWACHVVLLQDLCAWIMKKLGVQPKPFRSRLLLWVPLILALYMFVWPSFKRVAVFPALDWLATERQVEWAGNAKTYFKPVAPWTGLRFSDEEGRSTLTTENFWETFAGPILAVPFLFICGFGVVYFLGSKGFCTYGCPYAGFFVPADRFSPGRIVVNENCDQSGHCTATCTSNVRVHEEIREYGMVVDPGCMKCMDCVSVCPNEALSFQFARPSIAKGKPRHAPPKRRYDLRWGEEIGLAAVFFITFFGTRGLYNAIPMLMAVGIAGCATFILWKAWRIVTGDSATVRFHRWSLRRDGRLTYRGRLWALASLLLVVLILESALVQYHRWRGNLHYARLDAPYEQLFNPDLKLDADADHAARYALAHYRKADSFQHGGLGLFPTDEVQIRIANLHLVRRELNMAEARLAVLIERIGPSDSLCAHLGRIMILNDRIQETFVFWNNVLAEHPEFEQVQARLDALERLIQRGPDEEIHDQ